MYWRLTGLHSLAAAALVCASAEPARAAEAYVCAPDIVVYVEGGELEHKKRTNACVASHFGLTIESQTTDGLAARPANPREAKKVAPKVAQKPRPVAAKLAPVKFSTVIDDTPAAKPAPQRTADAASANASPAGAGYRNIRILNAASPETAWFHHSK